MGDWTLGEISNLENSIKKVGYTDYNELANAIPARSKQQIYQIILKNKK